MPARFTTIGHSARSSRNFSTLLRAAQVNPLIEVRSFPGRAPIPPSTSTGCLAQQIGIARPGRTAAETSMKFSTPSGGCGVPGAEFTIAFKELIRFRPRLSPGLDMLGDRLVAVPPPHHNRLSAPERPRHRPSDGLGSHPTRQAHSRRVTRRRRKIFYPARATR